MAALLQLSYVKNTLRIDTIKFYIASFLGFLTFICTASANMRANTEFTIPSSLMITPYHPDIIIPNETCNSVALIELTCPLDIFQHLDSARPQTI